jgi:callose synthase
LDLLSVSSSTSFISLDLPKWSLCRLEIIILLIVYLAYGAEDRTAVTYILLTISSWFLALSWLFAPYIFNPSGFEWQKTVEDFDDWTGWLFYKGGVGVKIDYSWEAWWFDEQVQLSFS